MESRSRSTWAGTHPTRQKHRFWSRPRTQGANIASFISIPQTPPRKVRRREPLYAFEFHWGRTGPTRHTRIETYQLSKPNKSTTSSPCLSICSLEAEYTHQPTTTQRLLSESSHIQLLLQPGSSSSSKPFFPICLLPSDTHTFTPNAITTRDEPTQHNTIQYTTPIILEKNKKPWKASRRLEHPSH